MLSSYEDYTTLAFFTGALVVGGMLARQKLSSKNKTPKNIEENILAGMNIDESTIKAAAAYRDEAYRAQNEDMVFEVSNDMKSELDSLGMSDDNDVKADKTAINIEANKQIEYFLKTQTSRENSSVNLSDNIVNMDLAKDTPENKSQAIASLISRVWSLIQTHDSSNDIIQKLIDTGVIKKPGTNLFSVIDALRCFKEASCKDFDKSISEIVIHNMRQGDVTKLLEELTKLASSQERAARTNPDEEIKRKAFRAASDIYCHIATVSGLHNINEAVKSVDVAVALDRDNTYAWSRLGDLSWQLGNYKTAEKAYIRALLLSNRRENKLLTLNASTRLAQIYRGREDFQLADNMDEEAQFIIKDINPEKESVILLEILSMIADNRQGKAIDIGGAVGWQSATS